MGPCDEGLSFARSMVLVFARPWLPNLVGIFVKRYDRDREVIVGFLKTALAASEVPGEGP